MLVEITTVSLEQHCFGSILLIIRLDILWLILVVTSKLDFSKILTIYPFSVIAFACSRSLQSAVEFSETIPVDIRLSMFWTACVVCSSPFSSIGVRTIRTKFSTESVECVESPIGSNMLLVFCSAMIFKMLEVLEVPVTPLLHSGSSWFSFNWTPGAISAWIKYLSLRSVDSHFILNLYASFRSTMHVWHTNFGSSSLTSICMKWSKNDGKKKVYSENDRMFLNFCRQLSYGFFI